MLGVRNGDRVLPEIELDGFLNGDTQEIAYEWNSIESRPISFSLRDGRSYLIDPSDCPEIIFETGECTIRITMISQGPGDFHDALDILSGDDRPDG